jgi:PAS domain S-box-containing protein
MESDAKYLRYIEELNSIIMGFDCEGRTTFFNSFSEKLFGYDRNEIFGNQIFSKIFPPEDLNGSFNAPDYAEIVAYPDKYYQNESECMCSDGTRIVVSWSAKALRKISGTVEEIIIDGNDITGLYRERKEAAENAAVLNALLDSVPEGIMITDAEHVVKR